MVYFNLVNLLYLYTQIVEQSGGACGLRDLELLKSAIAQPQMTFDSQELYPTLVEKAAAIGHSLIGNHPFLDGNKRIGHATIETFLLLNGFEISSTVDEQEQVILQLASGGMSREELTEWLKSHIVEKGK